MGIEIMFSFFNRSRDHLQPVSFIKRLKRINHLNLFKEVECGDFECCVVTRDIASDNIGQVLWKGHYYAAQLLSDMTEQWRERPIVLTQGVKVVPLGTHNGYCVVTTKASLHSV